MIDAALRLLDLVAIVVGWLSVGLLLAAAVVHVRRTVEVPPPPVTWRGRLCQGVVLVPTLAAGAAALLLDVPLAYGWGAVLAVVILLVLMRRDERFWAALAMLFPVFLVTGVALLLALAHNFANVAEGRLWYGGRQLEAWGGLHANPSYAHWEWTVVALAVTRYALPLALIVATTWVAAVRGPITRTERLGLVTASQSLLASVLIGSTFAVIVLGAGLLSGVPPLLVAVGVLGSLFALLTVGPGAVGGIIVEGRTLAARVPRPAQGAYTLATTIGDARGTVGGEPDLDAGMPVWRSLLGFVSGEVTGLRRLNFIGLGLFGGFVAISLVGGAAGGKVPDNEAVHFEYVDEEVGLGFVVDDAHQVAPDTVWLVGDGKVARFDPTTGDLEPTRLTATASTVDDGRLLLLTGGDDSTLIAVDAEQPSGPEAVVELDRHAAGELAVNADAVYVLGANGRIRRFDRETGERTVELGPELVDQPPTELVAEDDALWTVQGSDRFDRVVAERDPDTLEVVAEHEAPFGGLEVLAQEDPNPQLVALLLDDQLAVGEGAPWERRSRTFVADDGRPRWRSSGLGRLHRVRGGDPAEHWDFHYDSINGVFEAGDTTWLLVDDDQGTIVDETDPRESVLARWEGRTD